MKKKKRDLAHSELADIKQKKSTKAHTDLAQLARPNKKTWPKKDIKQNTLGGPGSAGERVTNSP